MTVEGVDYAFPPIPSAAALKAAGKHFACRYGGPGSGSKQLHAAELAALRAAGIDVVANAEGAPNALRTPAVGRAWALSARDHFRALGMPAARPIYFSVDWDAGPGDWAGIDAALRAAAAVIGAENVGVYGSYATVSHCHSAGSARWFWMTYAWSGGRTPPSFVHLYQYRNGQRIGGADCDFTRALQPDYGQWGYVEEDDMTVDELVSALQSNGKLRAAICDAVFNTDNVVKAPASAGADSVKANPFWAPGTLLGNTYNGVVSTRNYAAAAAAQEDPAKFAAALAPFLTGVSAADLQAALVGALKELAADTPASA